MLSLCRSCSPELLLGGSRDGTRSGTWRRRSSHWWLAGSKWMGIELWGGSQRKGRSMFMLVPDAVPARTKWMKHTPSSSILVLQGVRS